MGVLGNQLLPFDPSRTSGRPRDAERFNGDGSNTAFQLSVSISNPTDLEVFVENVQQEPITAYDAFGRTLTFSEAPPSGTNNIYVIYRNTVSDVHASIPDGSITFSKLANNIRLFTTDNFTGDGGTTTFNLSSDVADANTLMVAVDGVFQRAPIHYTASNSTITFSSAPPATSNVHVRHLGFRTTQTVTALPANITISQPTLESPTVTGTLTATGTVEASNLTRGGSQVYSRDNILGTVSQSSGVPTGAIIERGSNANGDFVKYADGTMICTRNIPSGTVINTTFNTQFFSYPSSFSNTNTLFVNYGFNVNSIGVGAGAGTDTRDNFLVSGDADRWNTRTNPSSLTISHAITLIAIGRWY